MEEIDREQYKQEIKNHVLKTYNTNETWKDNAELYALDKWVELRMEKFHDEIDIFNKIYAELKPELNISEDNTILALN